MTTETKTDIELLVSETFALATANEILESAKTTFEQSRLKIVEVLKAHQKDDWKKDLAPKIRSALEAQALSETQVKEWLWVYSTCMEYKVLPTIANASRFRDPKKYPIWTNWNGSKVPNTYKPKNKKAVAPVAPIAPVAPVVQNVETAPVAPVAPTPPVQGKSTGNLPKVTVSSDDALTPFEVWGEYFKRFMDHGVTEHYLPVLAALLKVKPADLKVAMMTAKTDLVAKAEKELAKN